jgi:hypothetical protein
MQKIRQVVFTRTFSIFSQHQLKILLNEVKDALMLPFLALKDAINHLVDAFQRIAEKLRKTLLEVKRTVSSLGCDFFKYQIGILNNN